MNARSLQAGLISVLGAGLVGASGSALASPGPQPAPLPDLVPAPKDQPYPGDVTLQVDARDVARRIFYVTEDIPVSRAGDLVLLFPQWIPGSHAPTGHLDQLGGLRITAAGKQVTWRRDPVDMYAFHVDVPAGVMALRLEYQNLSAPEGVWPRVATPAILDLDWASVILYPAGHFARQITYRPSVTLPAGWAFATSLDGQQRSGDSVSFGPVSLETLVDAPLLSGRYMRKIPLGGAVPVTLDVAADEPGDLDATPAQIAAHKALVTQAAAVFGAPHYSHYEFLLWLSDQMSGKGREHLQSSEDGLGRDYFTDAQGAVLRADLLSHEYTHSWNGKSRRPADLWAANFNTPERDSLLWVYEGQTQYWGSVLAARAGLRSRQDALDALAVTAADMDAQVGRSWRPLADTVDAPIIAYASNSTWDSWSRSADYYPEGELIWLDADTLIRQRSHGRRSLDDFARSFLGATDGSSAISTYTFEDVVSALSQVEPYDWATFLRVRLDGHDPGAPLDGLTRGGYRLVYDETPSPFTKASEAHGRLDLRHSIGFSIGKDGKLDQVQWESPAFRVGLAPGSTIIAVDGGVYSPERLKTAIASAKTTGAVTLIVKSEGGVAPVRVAYSGGLRYPHLERTAGAPDLLGAILSPVSKPRRP